MNLFDDLYDSEINFSITAFWDGGYHLRLGDELNGWTDEGWADVFDDVPEELKRMAIKHHPDSDFAKKHKATRYELICHLCDEGGY